MSRYLLLQRFRSCICFFISIQTAEARNELQIAVAQEQKNRIRVSEDFLKVYYNQVVQT